MNLFKNDDDVIAFVTDRRGGVSLKPYDSLNLALHVGDNIKSVIENRVAVCYKYKLILENLIFMDQTHSDNIYIVKDSSINKIENCDALITNIKNIPLMVMVADCIPILIYDYVNKVIAVVHAGRAGTFLSIVTKTVLKMSHEFKTKSENILVFLGPSIHSCCYEVGYDLADFTLKKFGLDYVIKKRDRFYIDLQKLNYDQLLSIGVKDKNIQMSEICTCCNSKYFSYRRDGVTGRFAGFMMLK